MCVKKSEKKWKKEVRIFGQKPNFTDVLQPTWALDKQFLFWLWEEPHEKQQHVCNVQEQNILYSPHLHMDYLYIIGLKATQDIVTKQKL